MNASQELYIDKADRERIEEHLGIWLCGYFRWRSLPASAWEDMALETVGVQKGAHRMEPDLSPALILGVCVHLLGGKGSACLKD